MNLVPLTPLMVVLVLSVISKLVRNQSHVQRESVSVYVYPKSIGYLVFCCAMVFAASPLLTEPGDHSGEGLPRILLPLIATSASLLVFLYLNRYKAILDKNGIQCGALFMRQFPYSSIVRAIRKGTTTRGQLELYSSSSRWPMTVSSSIVDYSSFLDDVRARLSGDIRLD